nr:hypothetical protein [Tanacetum cinerariifolium]
MRLEWINLARNQSDEYENEEFYIGEATLGAKASFLEPKSRLPDAESGNSLEFRLGENERASQVLAKHEANRVNAVEAGAGTVWLARARVAGPARVGAARPARGVVGGNVAPEVRGCTYKNFLNYNPHTVSETKGAVGLSVWFKKLELVFWISNCANENRVKFATCTLQARSLTWWNYHEQGAEIEQELWNLTVNGEDISGYIDHFHELAVMCPTMVTHEYKKIERYIWGLPESIHVTPLFVKKTLCHNIGVSSKHS